MLDRCQSSRGKSDPILHSIAKYSFALSSNPVQLPTDFRRLAQHIEVGLPISRRQRLVIDKMLTTLGSNFSRLGLNTQHC